LPRAAVVWAAESPDTLAAIGRAFGRLHPSASPHHLHQWWRLRHAWLAMEKHEQQRGKQYATVVRLRTDLRLPAALDLAPASAKALLDDRRSLVMRGDWIFWGARGAVDVAINGYVAALPDFHRLGQRVYMPLRYRHMVEVGAAGLGAGMFQWFKFPKETPQRPYGFTTKALNPSAFVTHVRRWMHELEAFEARGDGPRLPVNALLSGRDAWWKWDGIPDNEKHFFYHVLNRSLVPRNFLELHNSVAPAAQRVTMMGKTNGLLLPERHQPNCSCVCDA